MLTPVVVAVGLGTIHIIIESATVSQGLYPYVVKYIEIHPFMISFGPGLYLVFRLFGLLKYPSPDVVHICVESYVAAPCTMYVSPSQIVTVSGSLIVAVGAGSKHIIIESATVSQGLYPYVVKYIEIHPFMISFGPGLYLVFRLFGLLKYPSPDVVHICVESYVAAPCTTYVSPSQIVTVSGSLIVAVGAGSIVITK